jgi:hypothetical protein
VEFSNLLGDHVTDDEGAKLLAAFFVKSSLEFVAKNEEVVVVGIVGVDLGNSQDVVINVDLVAKEFLVTALKSGGQDGEFVHGLKG